MLRDKILNKGMKEKELGKRVKELMESGKARSEWSALRRIWEEIRVEEKAKRDFDVWALEHYVTKNKEDRVYSMGINGDVIPVRWNGNPDALKGLVLGGSIQMKDVSVMHDSDSGVEWFEATKKSKIVPTEIGANFLNSIPMLRAKPQTGQRVYRCYIQNVYRKTVPETWDLPRDQREYMPVLDTQTNAVNIVIRVSQSGEEDKESTFETKIATREQLENLLGKDLSWVDNPDVFKEIRYSLEQLPVFVFGYWTDTKRVPVGNNQWEDKPSNMWCDMRNYGYIMPIDEDGNPGAQ